MELSSPTQFGLSATPIQQSWVESKTLKCALFGQIRCFPLGQAVLPERHRCPRTTTSGPGIGEVVNRPVAGVITCHPEEPCVNSTCTVL